MASGTHGITPARAGKTPALRLVNGKGGDHPRACGKDEETYTTKGGKLGSPPRVRERRLTFVLWRSYSRITPARAGKTFLLVDKSCGAKDHPRACGKDCGKSSRDLGIRGSPPRVRERLIFKSLAGTAIRITPARAGKTRGEYRVAIQNEDHPRACGKDEEIDEEFFAELGSPPRVRERRQPPQPHAQQKRITPARAGKTIFHEVNGHGG